MHWYTANWLKGIVHLYVNDKTKSILIPHIIWLKLSEAVAENDQRRTSSTVNDNAVHYVICICICILTGKMS